MRKEKEQGIDFWKEYFICDLRRARKLNIDEY